MPFPWAKSFHGGAKVGNGPGEYFAICSYDADDQNIFLLSPGKMMVYDINGNFQKEIPIKEIVWGAIKRIENGFLVSCNQPLPDGNTIAYLDNECKIIKTALPSFEAILNFGL